MLGVFLALDLVLFYIFWEFTLIPMYFLIGIWGGERRIYAAVKFFLFTMAGSVLMLLAILYLGLTAGTFSLPELIASRAAFASAQIWLFLAFAAGLCHQGADVAAAYLAAGCACRSAHGRLGHPGGRAAEDGRLRFPALQPAALPGGHAPGWRPGWLVLAVIGILYGAVGFLPPDRMSRSWWLIPRSATWVL